MANSEIGDYVECSALLFKLFQVSGIADWKFYKC